MVKMATIAVPVLEQVREEVVNKQLAAIQKQGEITQILQLGEFSLGVFYKENADGDTTTTGEVDGDGLEEGDNN
jgi:hypothetical protein